MTQIPLQSRFKQDFVRLRFGTANYVNGIYSEGSVTATAHKGSVQPFQDRGSEVVQKLREGERTKKFVVIYTYPNTLRAVDERAKTKADIIIHEGETYEVQKVNRWVGQILTHDEVWAWEHDPGDLYPGETQPSGTSKVEPYGDGNKITIYDLGNYLTGDATQGLTITVNGVESTVNTATIGGSHLDTITVFIAGDVQFGDTVAWAYSATTGNLSSIISGVVPSSSGTLVNLFEAPA